MSTSDDNGGNRATVALVDAKVDGLKDLIRAEFKDVNRQLAGIPLLTIKVDGINDRLLITESRVGTVERRLDTEAADRRANHRWRTTDLPSLLIAFGLLTLGAVQAAHYFF